MGYKATCSRGCAQGLGIGVLRWLNKPPSRHIAARQRGLDCTERVVIKMFALPFVLLPANGVMACCLLDLGLQDHIHCLDDDPVRTLVDPRDKLMSREKSEYFSVDNAEGVGVLDGDVRDLKGMLLGEGHKGFAVGGGVGKLGAGQGG